MCSHGRRCRYVGRVLSVISEGACGKKCREAPYPPHPAFFFSSHPHAWCPPTLVHPLTRLPARTWFLGRRYQMTKMTQEEVNKTLAGPIALLKYKQTRVATIVADNACQIFGGRALTQSGMGVS